MLHSLALVVAVAAVTVALLGGAFFLVTTWLFVPPPVAGTTTTRQPAAETQAPASFEERLIGLYLALNRDKIEAAGDDPTPVVFTVEPGENAATIAAALEKAGLIRDEQLFRWLLRYRGADQSLEAGTFQLNRTMTMDEIIVALQQGRLEEISVTLPEGWRAEQVATALEAQGLFPASEYLAVVSDPSRFDYDFLRDLPPGATLEGFLFPDTYRVIKEQITPEAFVRMQLETFNQRLTPEMRRAAQERRMTLFQAVILASIVEREAVVAEERPLIAGVFINRWQDGILLNADPTVQYALGRQDGQWWKRPLLLEDLEVQSPYNTYKVPGLPPGPICNPGADALRATVSAPPTEFYYFVARGDDSGAHVFAKTFEEHQQNVTREQPRN
ncbi:MAG TPA: endolytic transglycosylase MltG [Chloroflexi bacterium]|nr:endolytic transglycosylase MltG [Chloroflexota bacterium]